MFEKNSFKISNVSQVCPTSLLTILKIQNARIDKFYVVQVRRATDLKAQKV